MANTPKSKPAPEPTPQDEAVNEGPPKLPMPTKLMLDALVVAARDALGANREVQCADQNGRVWTFVPDGDDGEMGLRVSAEIGGFDLGSNKLPANQLQCDGGDGIIRSAISIIAGNPK